MAADHAQLSQASAAATFVSCEPAALERHLQTKRKVGTTPESTHILRRTSVVVRQLAITNVVRPALTLKRELLARPLLCTLVLLLSDISCDKRLERWKQADAGSLRAIDLWLEVCRVGGIHGQLQGLRGRVYVALYYTCSLYYDTYKVWMLYFLRMMLKRCTLLSRSYTLRTEYNLSSLKSNVFYCLSITTWAKVQSELMQWTRPVLLHILQIVGKIKLGVYCWACSQLSFFITSSLVSDRDCWSTLWSCFPCVISPRY